MRNKKTVRIDSDDNWKLRNPILKRGEVIHVNCKDGFSRVKVGKGVSYSDTEFYSSSEDSFDGISPDYSFSKEFTEVDSITYISGGTYKQITDWIYNAVKRFPEVTFQVNETLLLHSSINYIGIVRNSEFERHLLTTSFYFITYSPEIKFDERCYSLYSCHYLVTILKELFLFDGYLEINFHEVSVQL